MAAAALPAKAVHELMVRRYTLSRRGSRGLLLAETTKPGQSGAPVLELRAPGDGAASTWHRAMCAFCVLPPDAIELCRWRLEALDTAAGAAAE